MSAPTPAIKVLVQAGVEYAIHTYVHDSKSLNFGEEAVQKLGVDPTRVFKTLIVSDSSSRPPLAVAIVPVSTMLSLKAFAKVLRIKKCVMATPAVAQRSSGYVVGGISPLGQRTPLPTFIDSSATRFTTVYISGGARGLDVELSPQDLQALTNAEIVEISER